jgi:hypothetical protein
MYMAVELSDSDNMGVIKHGNTIYGTLKDGQAQSDVIRLFQSIDRDLPCPFEYKWIESHTDSPNKRHVVKTEIHRDNNHVDALAKSALVEGITTTNIYISSDFPFELVRVRAGSKKLTNPLDTPFHHLSPVTTYCPRCLWLW